MTGPTFQRDGFSRAAMRVLLLLQVVAMITVFALILLDLSFLAFLISFVTLFAFGAIIVWLYARYQARPIVREKRELERLVLKFQKNLRTERNRIQAAISERARLAQAAKSEIQSALSTLQRNYIETGLAAASLDQAAIPGVGPKLKERLSGYGVVSAAQVSDRIAQLSGFGEAKSQALLHWRSAVLAHLESTKPITLPPEPLDAIKQKYGALQDKNNGAERKARSSQQILEHELASLKPRVQQLASITFPAYLSNSLASRAVVAGLLAFLLIIAQVISSVSATGAALIASIPTATSTLTLSNTPTVTATSTQTLTPTITLPRR
jgi:hypothetical protein